MIHKESAFVLVVILVVVALWCLLKRGSAKPQKQHALDIIIDPPVQALFVIQQSEQEPSAFFDDFPLSRRDPSLTFREQAGRGYIHPFGRLEHSSSFVIDYRPDQDIEIEID